MARRVCSSPGAFGNLFLRAFSSPRIYCYERVSRDAQRIIIHFLSVEIPRDIVRVVETREREEKRFLSIVRGLIAVDVRTNIAVPPFANIVRHRGVAVARIRLPILPMLIIPISIAAT